MFNLILIVQGILFYQIYFLHHGEKEVSPCQFLYFNRETNFLNGKSPSKIRVNSNAFTAFVNQGFKTDSWEIEKKIKPFPCNKTNGGSKTIAKTRQKDSRACLRIDTDDKFRRLIHTSVSIQFGYKCINSLLYQTIKLKRNVLKSSDPYFASPKIEIY